MWECENPEIVFYLKYIKRYASYIVFKHSIDHARQCATKNTSSPALYYSFVRFMLESRDAKCNKVKLQRCVSSLPSHLQFMRYRNGL